MKATIASLNDQVADLDQKLQFTTENFTMANEDLACREAQVFYYNGVMKQLEYATNNLNSLQNEYDSMVMEWTRDQETLLQANTQLSATKRDFELLKSELALLKECEKKWAAEKLVLQEDLSDRDSSLRDSNNIRSELQASVDELKKYVVELEQIKNELNEAKTQISTLRTKEKAGERQFKDLVAQHAMEMSAKNTAIESLELRISRAELKSRVLEKDRALVEPLKPEISKHQIFLNGRFDYFRGEYESLQKSYERLQERMNQCSCQHIADITSKGYVESLKSAQSLAQEEEHKRRQLLRDHTQLLHDYNKLITQHGKLTQEMKVLKENLQLREARRDRDLSRQATPIPSPIDNTLRPCRENAIATLTLSGQAISSSLSTSSESKQSSSLNSSPVPPMNTVNVESLHPSAASLVQSNLSIQDTLQAPGSSPLMQSTEQLNPQTHQPSLLKALNPMKRNIASVYNEAKDRPNKPPKAPDNCKQQ
ncbi:hypothetical protein THRCLA_21097 [Thraustotheca clavata]|uniref:Uncharacterized protein n=1 Tax=Thraustotheca clavata TaxID=74557 RepID=A0A1W0A0B9_9STRA|nr:hypothetical protein THRCLA_21097 [Thraustotheca clavata]